MFSREMQGKIKCFAFCSFSIYKGCLHMTLYFEFHTSFPLTVVIQTIFSFVSHPYWKEYGHFGLHSACQGRNRGWEIRVTFIPFWEGFDDYNFIWMLLYLNTGVWKESSVHVALDLWYSSIPDWIQQKGGNRGTKTSCFECLENKNLLGLKKAS